MTNKTNWLAIAAAVVAAMGIGFLWYGALFAEQWMAGNGITMQGEKIFKDGAEMPMSPTPMIINTVVMVLYALIMNWILGKTGSKTWMSGATVGAVIGGLMALGVYTSDLFANNPLSLTMVDGSYPLVLFTVMGAIIGGWQKK